MLIGEGIATIMKKHHYIEAGVPLMQISAHPICKEFLGCCLNHHMSVTLHIVVQHEYKQKLYKSPTDAF